MNDAVNKPNILLISADQLRCDAIGAYGNKVVKTPNIDSLASDGVVFENHFVQNPYCMPSRWSIFTGRYPKNHGVRENGVIFDNSEITLARTLKEAGYNTAATLKKQPVVAKKLTMVRGKHDDCIFIYASIL